jgi:hypothetical protein
LLKLFDRLPELHGSEQLLGLRQRILQKEQCLLSMFRKLYILRVRKQLYDLR